jgi:hypothetical protein
MPQSGVQGNPGAEDRQQDQPDPGELRAVGVVVLDWPAAEFPEESDMEGDEEQGAELDTVLPDDPRIPYEAEE